VTSQEQTPKHKQNKAQNTKQCQCKYSSEVNINARQYIAGETDEGWICSFIHDSRYIFVKV